MTLLFLDVEGRAFREAGVLGYDSLMPLTSIIFLSRFLSLPFLLSFISYHVRFHSPFFIMVFHYFIDVS